MESMRIAKRSVLYVLFAPSSACLFCNVLVMISGVPYSTIRTRNSFDSFLYSSAITCAVDWFSLCSLDQIKYSPQRFSHAAGTLSRSIGIRKRTTRVVTDETMLFLFSFLDFNVIKLSRATFLQESLNDHTIFSSETQSFHRLQQSVPYRPLNTLNATVNDS
jgi:hypothetical protein